MLKAGAHKGIDTVEMLKVVPGAIIYAFEPVPVIFSELQNRCRPYDNCFCFKLALADANEQRVFYVSAGDSDQSSSLLKPEKHLTSHPGVTFPKAIEVTAITLDSWAEKYGIDRIDCLWLDMQGYEFKMLRAAPKMLKTVQVIYTEINFIEMYKGCELFPEFKSWLEQEGFSLINIDYTWKRCGWGDALFIRNELMQKRMYR